MPNAPNRIAAPAALAAAVLFLAAGSAAAQEAVPLRDLPTVEQERIAMEAEVRMKEAERLYAEGKAHAESGEWKQAARSFEASAELRGDGDVGTAKLYRKAAESYYRAGNTGRAVRNFELAAESGMTFGDVNLAAESYLRAALVAHERGDATSANDNGWKAFRMSNAVGLDDRVRKLIGQFLIAAPPSDLALGGGSR